MERFPSRGRVVRRWAVALPLLVSLGFAVPVHAAEPTADPSAGEAGSGPTVDVGLAPTIRGFDDVDSSESWASQAIKYVAIERDWMTDFGNNEFRPNITERRDLFARALVLAFAPDADPDPDIEIADMAKDDEFYDYANIAVKRGWMQRNQDNEFRPDEAITMAQTHYALIGALPLGKEVDGLDNIHTADKYFFPHPEKFPEILLGMRLHFRYNHPTEGADVTPQDALTRAEVAYSLWRAATTDDYDIATLKKYQTIELPALMDFKRKFVTFGISYVGYPYIWGGDWYQKTPSGYCCGAQPQGGFDCSGLMWWDLKAPGSGYDNTNIRKYKGWSLPERTSADMASKGKKLTYKAAKPGDLMFYDGDNDGTVDHVDVYLGNGWALDSSSGQGGVTILRVGEGWYRDHFVHARHIM